MSTQSIDLKVKEIKQTFRQMMDGATARSMREKGLDYRLNWGATIPRLRQMADEIISEVRGEDKEVPTSHLSFLTSLSIALWKENIRECKILATMLMPADEVLPEVIDIWMEQTPTLEIAEQAAFNLYQHLPYAADKAFEWLASADDLPQICGYHVFSRLFMRGQEPNERGINEFLDQAIAAVQSPNAAVRKAAMQSVIRFSQLGLVYERLAKSAIRRTGLDFL
ncbi:MAG: DNA alkylation repair protein [Prevotella sp.]|nr:DNA alkylation repair protein [Prevotella sp.]